jgi:hypothetical protein
MSLPLFNIKIRIAGSRSGKGDTAQDFYGKHSYPKKDSRHNARDKKVIEYAFHV